MVGFDEGGLVSGVVVLWLVALGLGFKVPLDVLHLSRFWVCGVCFESWLVVCLVGCLVVCTCVVLLVRLWPLDLVFTVGWLLVFVLWFAWCLGCVYSVCCCGLRCVVVLGWMLVGACLGVVFCG